MGSGRWRLSSSLLIIPERAPYAPEPSLLLVRILFDTRYTNPQILSPAIDTLPSYHEQRRSTGLKWKVSEPYSRSCAVIPWTFSPTRLTQPRRRGSLPLDDGIAVSRITAHQSSYYNPTAFCRLHLFRHRICTGQFLPGRSRELAITYLGFADRELFRSSLRPARLTVSPPHLTHSHSRRHHVWISRTAVPQQLRSAATAAILRRAPTARVRRATTAAGLWSAVS